MSKILYKVATGNGDTPVNDKNSSVGNLFLQMPSKSYWGNAQKEIENDENLQNFKVPQFCQSKYKGKPVLMFRRDNNRQRYNFIFIKLITLTRTTTLINPCLIKIDIKIFSLSY